MSISVSALAFACAAAAAADLAWRRIPNALNVGILLFALALRAVDGGIASVGWGLAGAGIGLVLMFPLFAKRWLGAGDVKLAAALGAWVGPVGAAWTVVAGIAAGGVLCLFVLAAGGTALRRQVVGNLAAITVGGEMAGTDTRPARHKVPLAVALAAAALVVFVTRGSFHA
jgi:prepilin peptidase CpaA